MTGESMTESLRETLAVFDSRRPLTTSEVTAHLDVGRRSTYDRLKKLADGGHLETKEVGARGRVWWRAQSGSVDGIEDGSADVNAVESADEFDDETVDDAAATEELFVSLVDAVEEYAIFLLDTDGCVRTWNPGAERIKGYDREDIVGQHFSTFYTEEAVAADVPAENLARAAEQGSVEDTGWRVRDDGSRFWANVTITAIRDEDGNLQGYAKVTRDMSDRRRFEERLRRQRDTLESELDEVFERIDDAFFAVDEQWQFTYVTDKMAKFAGRSADELLETDVADVLPAFDGGRPRAVAERAIETQESAELSFFSAHLDRHLHVGVYPSETGLSAYVRDVTERKERERHLEQYETVARTASDVIVSIDTEGTIQMANPAVEDVFGYEPDDLVGASIRTLLSDEMAADYDANLRQYLETGDRQGNWDNLEVQGEHADGNEIPLAISFNDYEHDGERFLTGIVRDVSQRTKREQQLRAQFRQQEAIADLGQLALNTDDVDALMAEVSERVADVLDNDYCKVLDLQPEADELLLRQGVGWQDGLVGDATVSASEDSSQAAYTLEHDEPVVVTDLETEYRFSGPSLLRNHDVRSGISVVIGSHEDPWGILGTHDSDRTEFSTHDVNFVQSVANILTTAINRHSDERELRRKREQLEALNTLNVVFRDITDAVVEQPTREEVEQTVCDHLADTDSYEFAWVGAVDVATGTVNPRTEAGVENYLEGTTITIDPEDTHSQGPTARAVQTREMQVVEDALTDESYEAWREKAREHRFVASAAIPVVHESTIYGVLNVYSDRPEAFTGRERAVLQQLGEVVGHAIAAVERKRALMSDEVVELDFAIPGVFDELDVDVPADCRLEITKTVPTGADSFLAHGTANAAGVELVDALTETLPNWNGLLRREETDDGVRFQVRISESTILSMVASQGGRVERAVFEGDKLDLRLHLRPRTAVRQVIDTVQSEYPTAEMLSRRQVTRDDDPTVGSHRDLEGGLTERQVAALRAAYGGGFFEWPRTHSGEEIADSMGVAPPTFHQHLRKAEQKVLDAVLEETID
ncbi:PAS domain S-box protein [Halobacterium zhouii]|uniref:PAS domain S-box protein n=1 Tax=Halobacterium zhouii TaxID=2902624 RepID=UPI001E5CD995|nr:PAS domain S-box protein [Halobacterium zhouii]